MKKFVVKTGILLSTSAMVATPILPSISVHAAEIDPSSEVTPISISTSDIGIQFQLNDEEIALLRNDEEFSPTTSQQEAIDKLLSKRVIGLDDVLSLIAIIGAGYAAGHWAGAQAHKRFGLTPAKYKANRWWWRAGITAAAGVPAAVGFDDYFYGI